MGETERPQDRSSEAAEHAKAAAMAFVETWKSLLPDKFWQNSAEFGRESQLAAQAAIETAQAAVESAIAKLERVHPAGEGEEAAVAAPPRPTRKAKVAVG